MLHERDALEKLGFGDDPSYYLVCHALELSLKAFLRARGYNDQKLRHLDHNFKRCLKSAQRNGLANFIAFDETQTKAIKDINRLYKHKEFEYVVFGGTLSVPRITVLLDAVDEIVEAIRRECFEVTVREREANKLRRP